MEISQFDIFWVTLDPTVGSEMQKTRPAVVVSPNELNEYLNTVIIAPLTSTFRENFAFRPQVQVNTKKGEIALDQIRSVDKSRLQSKIGRLSQKEMQKVLLLLQEMFAE